MSVTIGQAVVRVRQLHDLTQKDLAEKLGVDPSHVSHLEADRREPSIALLRGLAEISEHTLALFLLFLLWEHLSSDQRDAFSPLIADAVMALPPAD